MSEELTLKKMGIAGQIVCELISKDVLPKGLTKHGGLPIEKVAVTLGTLYQSIWRYIDSVPEVGEAKK